MENNNYNNQQQNYQQPNYQQPNYQQPNYQQPYGGQYSQPYQQQAYQQIDPNYDETASGFLKSAIIGCVLAGFPVASIIAIFKGKGNRKKILEYLEQGGMHTPKIKTASCLSRAATYGGIGMTIFYGIYFLYFGLIFAGLIFSAIGSSY